MASGRTKGFWRRARNGLLSQDQVMAVDVQFEDHIREIEGLVAGYRGVLKTRPHARMPLVGDEQTSGLACALIGRRPWLSVPACGWSGCLQGSCLADGRMRE